MIKIILTEDHPLVIAGIESLLTESPGMHCIGICTTGADLLQALRKEVPDVLLLDINLPDANGLDLCASIKTSSRPSPLLRLRSITSLASSKK